MKNTKINGTLLGLEAYSCCDFEIFCIIIYCVSMLSLYVVSTDSYNISLFYQEVPRKVSSAETL